MGSIADGYNPCDDAFFQCGAEELAIKLLGKYLYCKESEILVRILETEAYPDGMLQSCITQLVTKTPNLLEFFHIADDQPFPDKAGVVVALGEALFRRNPRLVKPGRGDYLYVTAGGEGDARGVVLIRSCAPHVQMPEVAGDELVPAYFSAILLERFGIKKLQVDRRTSLMIGPNNVAKALGNDWESNLNLSEGGGVQLLHEKLVARPVPQPDSEPDSEPESEPEPEPEPEHRWEVPRLEPILHGPRIAPKASYVRRCLYGRDPDVTLQQLNEKLRFALHSKWRYPYYDEFQLVPMPLPMIGRTS